MRRKDDAHEVHAEQRHREWLDGPIDEKRDTDASCMLLHFRSARAKSIFSSIGTTISQTSTATGTLTSASFNAPTAADSPGSNCASRMPAAMHANTHHVRLRSNEPMRGTSARAD